MKLISNNKIFSLVTISIILSTFNYCDSTDMKLKVRNDSDSSVFFIIPIEPDYFPTTEKSDSNFKKKKNDSLLNIKPMLDQKNGGFGGVHFVKKHSTKKVWAFNTKWEEIIESSKNKQLEIMFYYKSVLANGSYTWKEILDNKMYFEKRQFSKEDLIKLNWLVTLEKK